jgi:non-ribosomal peptide synthetase component F
MERLALGLEQVPTSAAQRRLWILQKLEPESSASNRPLGIRLKGELDLRPLEASLNEIVRRHDALRTIFPERDGEPIQHLVPQLALSVEVRVLDALPIDVREPEAQRIAIEEANKPFNLTRGPLIRVVLLRLASEEHLLLVLMHHIVFDGWSENVFIHEFQVLYNAFAEGKESPLPELPLQYADFALWQNQRPKEQIDQELRYWKENLSGIPTVLQLPSDYPRKQPLVGHGATWSMLLEASLTCQLKHLSRRENVTLFMTLLSGFQLLLSRYAGQDDILIGVPVAGRTLPQVEGLIGCFMNMLVMRTSLAGNPSFAELLKRVRETALQAYTRQETPFERLVEELHPARQISRWPLFQVMFNLRNLPNSPVPYASGIQLEPYSIRRGTIGGLDLSLEVKESGEGLCCTFNYAQELFRRQTIEQMGRVFRTLLETAVVRSDSPISQLLRLTEEERHRVLVEWNQTEREYPGNRCIHQLFEKRAQEKPQAVAVVFEGEGITYQQLNQKATQLARYLRSLGAAPETVVGILVDRSLDLVIGLLGILKAGAAYVPLDPTYPANRIAFMLEDSQARIVLTHERLLPSLTETQVQPLCLDSDWSGISDLPNHELDSGVTTDNLAYVMYTSGSTGKPKAVMINHRSVCNYLLWRCDYFPLAESDRVLQKAPLSFDDSVWEIFEPLMVGAQIVMVRSGGHQDSRSVPRCSRLSSRSLRARTANR